MHQSKASYRYLFSILFLLVVMQGYAQQGFFVPKSGKVFFNGDTATIFSNVINNGQLGFGKRSVVNFKGKKWENDLQSLITDESNNGNGNTGEGGILRFLLPDLSLPADIDQQQILSGGYNIATRTGPSFSNVWLDNSWGVKLINSTSRIRNQLHFVNGHVHAEENSIITGDKGPGLISGYNENRFVITGKGALVRENMNEDNGLVIFPVGISADKYTPAGIYLQHTDPDDFYVRVDDSVRMNRSNGINLADLSVNKTWQIGKLLRPGKDIVTVQLQHLLTEEGSQFRINRDHSFVSQFMNARWDTGSPQLTPITPGSLTTGTPDANGGMNSRQFNGKIETESYFTKLSSEIPDTSLTKTRFRFWAYRTDWDNVSANWTTKPEINTNYFIVQRRLSNETGFTNVDTVFSKTIGGISYNFINYSSRDPNSYRGISYYRLVLVDYNGLQLYSQIVPVGGRPEDKGITIWPNPSGGHFYAGISGAFPVKSIIIWNALGQKIKQEEVNGRTVIGLDLQIQGAYFIGFISAEGRVITTKKMIIAGDQ